MTGNALNTTPGRGLTLAIVWAATLLVSLLPDILVKELSGNLPARLYAAKVGLIVALLLVSLSWKRLRPLWLFFAVLLAVFVLQRGVERSYETLACTTWFAGAHSLMRDVGPGQILRATTGILLVLVMLVLVRRFDRFFFVKGKLDAPAAPIPLITSKPVFKNEPVHECAQSRA